VCGLIGQYLPEYLRAYFPAGFDFSSNRDWKTGLRDQLSVVSVYYAIVHMCLTFYNQIVIEKFSADFD
jgi:hypothetical protein